MEPAGDSQSRLRPGAATLQLGGRTYDVGRATGGVYNVADMARHAFWGTYMTFVPPDGCAPGVTIVVAEMGGYTPPLNIDLDDSLCPGSAARNVQVIVATDETCSSLPYSARGTLHLESYDAVSGAARGWVEATVVDEGGAEVDMRLDFDIGASLVVAAVLPHQDGDLCAAP